MALEMRPSESEMIGRRPVVVDLDNLRDGSRGGDITDPTSPRLRRAPYITQELREKGLDFWSWHLTYTLPFALHRNITISGRRDEAATA